MHHPFAMSFCSQHCGHNQSWYVALVAAFFIFRKILRSPGYKWRKSRIILCYYSLTFGERFLIEKVVDDGANRWYDKKRRKWATTITDQVWKKVIDKHWLLVIIYQSCLLTRSSFENWTKFRLNVQGPWYFGTEARSNICEVNSLEQQIELFEQLIFIWEFDPGSGWTLAACLIHASRTSSRWWSVLAPRFNMERVADGWVTRG